MNVEGCRCRYQRLVIYRTACQRWYVERDGCGSLQLFS